MTAPLYRPVRALRGAQWLVNAYYLFRRNPGSWMLLMLVILVSMLVLGAIPLVGPLIFGLLFPIFSAGLGLAARSTERGESVQVDQLLAGFRTSPGDLVAIGGFYLVGQVVVLAVMMGLGGPALQAAAEAARSGAALPADGAGVNVLLAALAGLSLLLPLLMATWFAPLLVMFHQMKALPALQLSLRAGLGNWRAFLVYALSMVLLMIGARLVVSTLSWVPLLGPGIALAAVGALLAVVTPIAFIAFYVSYSDVFPEPQDGEPAELPAAVTDPE
jgi:hypothetical protein